MNNYIILNGINSNTITGLIIQSLPPISKPLMRTNIETIDGKDGDIITKLGYSAYDKEISIGLSYNYNVDDVIEFFNSEGTVIFSNEPTKYYKYTILDQIDFNRLIRFKTATVRMHVQPFKYSTTEEDIEENATETDAEGTNFTLENTENGAGFIDLKLKGDTYQEQTEGYNQLKLNTYSNTNFNTRDTYVDIGNHIRIKSQYGVAVELQVDENYINTTLKNTYDNSQIIQFYNLKANTVYTIACTLNTNVQSGNINVFGRTSSYSETKRINTFTTDANGEVVLNLHLYISSSKTAGLYVNLTDIMLLEGPYTSATLPPYEPYTYGPTPNPNYPQDIDVVTGDNTVTLCGKNLFDKDNASIINAYFDGSHTNLTSASTNRTTYCKVKPNTTYTISKLKSIRSFIGTTQTTPALNVAISNISNIGSGTYDGTTRVNGTITTGANDNYIVINYSNTNTETGDVPTSILNSIQIEVGTSATPYAPYQSQSFTLSLGDIELCKIGDYQDYIYKSNGTWYLYKTINKVTFNGTETWTRTTRTDGNVFWNYYDILNVPKPYLNSSVIKICNYFPYEFKTWGDVNLNCMGENGLFNVNRPSFLFRISTDILTTLEQWLTWLSTNNTTVYYVLAEPTTTEITDATLISQLNALNGATTYEGQTNIITAGDLQPIIYVKTFAMDNPSYTVTNSGNYFAKPVMTIYGIGTVGVYLDGVQVLSLNLNENQTDHITIDVPNMNAYTDTINTLRNRAVTGDYNNLKFNVGDNELSFSGTIQGFIIQNYSRWL